MSHEHCVVEDVFKVEGTDELRAYLTEYLKPFAKPQKRADATEGMGFALGYSQCLKCGFGLDGMFGTFEWGIVHGEGKCGHCGWPTRMYHYLKLPSGEEGRLVFPLQYHPDFVTKRKSA
jgi:hypothetical protein